MAAGTLRAASSRSAPVTPPSPVALWMQVGVRSACVSLLDFQPSLPPAVPPSLSGDIQGRGTKRDAVPHHQPPFSVGCKCRICLSLSPPGHFAWLLHALTAGPLLLKVARALWTYRKSLRGNACAEQVLQAFIFKAQ